VAAAPPPRRTAWAATWRSDRRMACMLEDIVEVIGAPRKELLYYLSRDPKRRRGGELFFF
jgi:hypothetical protein